MRKLCAILLICSLVFLGLPAQAWADGIVMEDEFWQVASGNGFTLALRHDGTLWAWGLNDKGQLGNGGVGDAEVNGSSCQSTPVLIMDEVRAIAAGFDHALAIKNDDSLWSWGNNYSGQLGNGGKGNQRYPAQDAGNEIERYYQTVPRKAVEDVEAVSAGDGFSLILKTDGTLWSCGTNVYGQLGNGGLGSSVWSTLEMPIQVSPVQIMDEAIDAAAGASHSLALKKDGSVWAWGNNQQNALGNEGQHDQTAAEIPYQSTPVQIADALEAAEVTQISAGLHSSLAVTKDQLLYGWGQIMPGQESFATPQEILGGVRRAYAGYTAHFALLTENNSLWGWGENKAKLVHYDFTPETVFAEPRQLQDQISQISSHLSHTMMVRQNGTLWGWGDNTYGQLAQQPGSEPRQPVRVRVEYPEELPVLDEDAINEAVPEPQAEPQELPATEPLKRTNPLPYVAGGVVGAGLLGAGGWLLWKKRHVS